jgi:site-specific DNA-methyltransferase (adenine-specific)
MGWVFWDKRIGGDFSDGELAYTSFQRALQKVTLWNGNNGQARIHPTQKPVNLYAWLLREYAEAGWRLLDTHMGSGSSVIAAVQAGHEMLAIEKDEEYYATAVERIGRELKQGVIL